MAAAFTSNNQFSLGQPVTMSQSNVFGPGAPGGNPQSLNMNYNLAFAIGPNPTQSLPTFGQTVGAGSLLPSQGQLSAALSPFNASFPSQSGITPGSFISLAPGASPYPQGSQNAGMQWPVGLPQGPVMMNPPIIIQPVFIPYYVQAPSGYGNPGYGGNYPTPGYGQSPYYPSPYPSSPYPGGSGYPTGYPVSQYPGSYPTGPIPSNPYGGLPLDLLSFEDPGAFNQPELLDASPEEKLAAVQNIQQGLMLLELLDTLTLL